MATKTAILRPLSIISSTNWGANSGTLLAAIDPGDPVSHDDDTTYGGITEPNANELIASLTNKPNDILSVTSVTPKAQARVVLGTVELRVGVRLLGTSGYTSASTVIGSYGSVGASVVRPGGGAWLPSDIADSTLYVIADPVSFDTGGDSLRVTSLWIELAYEPIPAQTDGARDAASRKQWLNRESPRVLERQHLDIADVIELDLMDRVNVSHRFGPEVAGAGWGAKKWERRFMRDVGRVFNPGSRDVTVKQRDERPLLCLYRDTMWSPISSAPWADGVARFGKDLSRTFARTSRKWVRDPNGVYVQIEIDQEPLADEGMLLEGERENLQVESAFKNGATDTYTGWTITGESGGNAVEDDTSVLAWDVDVVGRSVKTTWASASGVDLYLAGTALALTANDVFSVSVIHQDDSGEAGYVRLQRSVDSWYWNEGSGAWQSGSVWNALTVSSAAFGRHSLKGIDIGGSNSNLTVDVGVDSGAGVDGQVNHWAHVQVEIGAFPSSPILTETVAVTRTRDDLSLSSDSSGRKINMAQGTLAVEFVPLYDAADLSSETPVLYQLVYDANNRQALHYDASAGNLVFRRKVGGTNYDATVTYSPVAGTAVKIVTRWTGDEGELDLTDFTSSIFLDGTKGTDVVTTAAPTETASATIHVGDGVADTLPLFGHLRLLESLQYVATDEECVRLPRG